MIPYGKRKVRHNYKDYHPKKGYINWWEKEMNFINKKKERQSSKRFLKECNIKGEEL